ncbi:MAG: hypothetical protein AAFQ02_11445 [Bacteroidota bacterium]
MTDSINLNSPSKRQIILYEWIKKVKSKYLVKLPQLSVPISMSEDVYMRIQASLRPV